LATATYPITVDPNLIYSNTSDQATFNNNSPHLVFDNFAKQVLLSVDSQSHLVASWSNDTGATWSSGQPFAENGLAATLATDPSNTTLLHAGYQATAGGVKYQALTISRDGSNNITGLSASGSAVTLD